MFGEPRTASVGGSPMMSCRVGLGHDSCRGVFPVYFTGNVVCHGPDHAPDDRFTGNTVSTRVRTLHRKLGVTLGLTGSSRIRPPRSPTTVHRKPGACGRPIDDVPPSRKIDEVPLSRKTDDVSPPTPRPCREKWPTRWLPTTHADRAQTERSRGWWSGGNVDAFSRACTRTARDCCRHRKRGGVFTGNEVS